jgi:hypothetical protein
MPPYEFVGGARHVSFIFAVAVLPPRIRILLSGIVTLLN